MELEVPGPLLFKTSGNSVYVQVGFNFWVWIKSQSVIIEVKCFNQYFLVVVFTFQVFTCENWRRFAKLVLGTDTTYI